jgi:hypothetical protein
MKKITPENVFCFFILLILIGGVIGCGDFINNIIH